MEDMIKLAASYGFPMVMAGYLLVRLEPVIKELQKSITLLTMVVAKQSDIDMEQMQRVKNSQHLLGNAVDIVVAGVTPGQVTATAKEVGFTGVGLYTTFTHVDVRSGNSARWSGGGC